MGAAVENMLEVRIGSGDVVKTLNELRDRAVIGEIEGIAFVVCTADDKDSGQMGYAFRDDMAYPFARLIASALSLKDYLRAKAGAS
jgi:hypothetical protein